jgi:hypothetical protein
MVSALRLEPSATPEIVLLVKALLGMALNVLDAPLIVLLVSVCAPVSVATVLSMAMVTGVAPLKDVPDSPVPMVRALVVLAVTVVDPPKLTELPLIVIALLVRLELPMLLKVLDAPLMVLFVSVCAPVNVATVESMAMVIGAEPSNMPPDNPVPMVNGFMVIAVTVVVPPKLTEFPLIVMALLANWALLIVPLKSVVGTVGLAVNGNPPLPLT